MRLDRFMWLNVLLLMVLVAGCGPNDMDPSAPAPTSSVATDNTTYVVQRGTVTRKLEFTGRIVPVAEVPLFFKTAGYVKEVHAQQGDQVKAGDLLAELETDELQEQIALTDLDVEIAQASLNQAEEANEYALAQAEMALEVVQTQLSAAEQLLNGRISAAAAAQVTLEQAEAVAEAENEEQAANQQQEVAIAQRQLYQTIAEREAARYEVTIQQIAVDQAEAELEWLRQVVNPVLELGVQRAELALDLLKEGSQLFTPVDGEVVSLSLYPGRPVEPFVPVVVIADPSAIEVSANLTDDQLEHLAEGQQAEVALSADPEPTWPATVRRLPYPYGTGGSGENPTGIDTSTRISLEGDVTELELGALVQVTIVMDERQDVLWLPPDAIRAFQGGSFVILQDRDRQQRVNVETGMEGEDQVEILKGLREGQVAVAP